MALTSNMTPIRQRGKNKRDQSKAALLEKKTTNDFGENSERTIAKRPRGRPIKPGPTQRRGYPSLVLPMNSPSASMSRASTPARNDRKRSKQTHFSTIELLPPEIVQEIFLWSRNTNLALASPRLASLLSSADVYMKFAFMAFEGGVKPTKNYLKCRGNFRSPIMMSDPVSAPKYRAKMSEWGQLQGEILGCKWATYEWWMRFQRRWRKKMEFKERQQLPTPPDSDGPSSDPDYSREKTEPYDVRYQVPFATTWPAYFIPRKLLSTPFTESKTKFLISLTKDFNMRVQWTDSLDGEIATNSVRTAITTSNLEMLRLLCGPSIRVRIDTSMLQLAATHSQDKRGVFRALYWAIFKFQRAPKYSNIGHFYGSPSPEESSSPIDFRDPYLWSWTARREEWEERENVEMKERVGEWMLEILREKDLRSFTKDDRDIETEATGLASYASSSKRPMTPS